MSAGSVCGLTLYVFLFTGISYYMKVLVHYYIKESDRSLCEMRGTGVQLTGIWRTGRTVGEHPKHMRPILNDVQHISSLAKFMSIELQNSPKNAFSLLSKT